MQNHQFRSGPRYALIAFFEAVLITALLSYAAFSQTPKTAEEYVATGNALVQVGHLDNAIAFYTKAIELKPDLADAYNNRGFVYTRQANLVPTTAGTNNANEEKRQKLARLAVTDLDKAIGLRPQYAMYYRNRAAAYLLIDKLKTLDDLSSAIKIDPVDIISWLDRCRVNHLVGTAKGYYGKDWERTAVSDCTEVIRLRPDLVDAYMFRGKANANLINWDLAIADFSQAIQSKPDYADAYALRSDQYRAKDQYELALADAYKAIALRPQEPAYYQRRGWVYLKMAGVPYDGAVDRNKTYVNSAAELAIEDFSKAILLRPNYSNAYSARGTAYCALGNTVQANSDYKRASELGNANSFTCH